jgi:hypothetical protein
MHTSTEVLFQSAFFKPVPGEDRNTVPGRYGKALANWLVEKLKERAFPVEDAVPEDCWWRITLRYPAFKIYLCCGNTRKEGTEWMVWSLERLPFFKSFFHFKPFPELGKLDQCLRELLPTIPDISNIRW